MIATGPSCNSADEHGRPAGKGALMSEDTLLLPASRVRSPAVQRKCFRGASAEGGVRRRKRRDDGLPHAESCIAHLVSHPSYSDRQRSPCEQGLIQRIAAFACRNRFGANSMQAVWQYKQKTWASWSSWQFQKERWDFRGYCIVLSGFVLKPASRYGLVRCCQRRRSLSQADCKGT